MKASQYAKKLGVDYQTVLNWFHAGHIRGRQLPTGTIIITEPIEISGDSIKDLKAEDVVIYARASSSEDKHILDAQADRCLQYCLAKGWAVKSVIKEVGSGLNDQRRKLQALLKDDSVKVIVVEHRDRLTRFGFNYIDTLLRSRGRGIEVINPPKDEKEDLLADFVGIVTSFCARIYGQRRSKRDTEKIIKRLQNNE